MPPPSENACFSSKSGSGRCTVKRRETIRRRLVRGRQLWLKHLNWRGAQQLETHSQVHRLGDRHDWRRSFRLLRVRRFEPWLGVFPVLLRRNIASCRAPKLALSFFLHISAAIAGLSFASL
jgi:hypothetical protein